jgi:hypothetical protein
MSELAQPKLAGALLKLQDAAPTLTKDASGQVGSRHYKYTPLDTIVEKIGPLLVDNGLVWTTRPSGTAEAPTLVYELIHAKSGEAIAGEMPLMIGDNPTSQALGSAITYARRYALTAVLNLVADEDDDGAASQSYGRAPSGARASTYGQRPKEYNAAADNGREATKAQKGKVRGEATKAGLKFAAQWVEFTKSMLGKSVMVDDLTFDQASFLIDKLQQGAIPTGRSDVPDDASGFEQPTLEGGDPVPFDEEPKSNA